jgi:alkylation response protein AidB-like acyl-CoA dehydrogenase
VSLAQVQAARSLAPLLHERADDGERDRRLAPEVADALVSGGFFRMLVPESLGGGESDPATFVATVEELSRADAAAGWCIAACATSGMVAAYLDEAAAREVFGSAGSVSGGVFAPRGRAQLGSSGYTVSGRWAFASGIDHCDWLMGGCFVMEDGQPRMVAEGRPDIRLMLFPADDVEVLDTWRVSGLRGTGSHDMEVHEVRVPEERSASLLTDAPLERGPLYAFPVFGLLALSIAGVAVGVARGALADVVELAGGKTPTLSSRRLAERAATQAGVARSEASLRAARELLYAEIERGWNDARRQGEVSVERRAALRLAATHATTAAAAAVDVAYELGGGTSIYETSQLQRRFRDVHAATQHMLVGPATWELTGRVLLGMPTEVEQL